MLNVFAAYISGNDKAIATKYVVKSYNGQTNVDLNSIFAKYVSTPPPSGPFSASPPESYVSSYNSEHTYKYQFTSDEQKMAYYRAERQILAPSYMK